MASSKGMTDSALGAMVRAAIDDAKGYDKEELAQRRARAIDYFEGRMEDVPSQPGRSSVTSRDLSDAIGWILPSLMRVFTAGDRVAEYDPQGEEDEAGAKLATEYVNYVFLRECNGYTVLYTALLEALQFGNGIVKHWWDTSVEYETQDYTGLDDMAFTQLVADDGVDVLQHSQTSETMTVTDPASGQPVTQEVVTHDVKIRRAKRNGKLRVVALPPEEFLIEKEVVSLEDASFVAHRSMMTRATLIALGYDRKDVMAIPKASEVEWTEEYTARHDDYAPQRRGRAVSDPLMEEVEIFECYIKADYDGDDWPEWRKVVMAGGGSQQILANDEWGEDVPFSDIAIMPRPHRWDGRSILDELEDVQKVKTVLIRQTLDNLYLQNNPMKVALSGAIENPDVLLNPEIGAVVYEKTAGAVRDVVTPFVAANSFQMLSYLDEVSERRTGVSRTSMALDPEVLQNQTASGVNAAQSAAFAKIELYARNAAVGVRRMFRCMLRAIIRHQDKPKRLRFREQWVEMDPRVWNSDMDAEVSVGLGSGSRDRDMAILQQIYGMQQQIIGLAGPQNPIVPIEKAVRTLRKMVEVAGIKNADAYFGEVSPEQVNEFMAKLGGDKPDPEVEKAKAQIALEQEKAKANFQLEQQKASAQLQFDREKAAADLQAARERQAMEVQAMREKAQAELEIKRQTAVLDAQLRREEMQIEAQLTAEANRMNAAVAAKKADTNVKGPE